jgi:NADH-quinone oxidoreductase subunit N
MNVGAFGVLQLIPSRDGKGSAETFEDLAGQGRKRVGLGLAMAVCCFSLIGIPLTIGFLGKLMIIKPALAAAVANPRPGAVPVRSAMSWLIVITMVNAAISAAYYLKIVATMFLRTEDSAQPAAQPAHESFARPALPIMVAVVLSVVGTLMFGTLPPAAEMLGTGAVTAANLEGGIPSGAPTSQPTAPSVAASR